VPNAFAFSKAESNFLKGIKSYKITALKKNTDKELLAIGRTSCGDVYYAATVASIYKKNHYKENSVSAKAMMTEAKKYLCVKEVTLVLDNGDVITAKIYDPNAPVIDAGTVYSSGTQTESKIQNAQKQPPRPTSTISVDVLNTKPTNDFKIALGDLYKCNFITTTSNPSITYRWYYSFPTDVAGFPTVEIANQGSSQLEVTQEMLSYLSKSEDLYRSILCKVISTSSQGEVLLMERPKIGNFPLTAR
jgi:hypothetical protein